MSSLLSIVIPKRLDVITDYLDTRPHEPTIKIKKPTLGRPRGRPRKYPLVEGKKTLLSSSETSSSSSSSSIDPSIVVLPLLERILTLLERLEGTLSTNNSL